MKEIINSLTIPLAIIAICVIECVALCNGHNGTILMITIAIISGLAGYKIPGIINRIKNKDDKSG